MKRLFQRNKDKKHDTTHPTYDSVPAHTVPGQQPPESPLQTQPTAPPIPPAATNNDTGGPIGAQNSNRNGIPRPPRVQDVANAIGWSCGVGFDFAYILNLADYLIASKDASKDAAKALTKEFKHAAPPAQERAVRLTGILFRNTNSRFQQQVAQKKFLSALTALASSSTSTPSVRLMVFRVLSPLAYECSRDPDLSSITHAYDALLSDPKTRPSPETLGGGGAGEGSYDPALFPPHGAPLDPEDPLFRPEALLPSSATAPGGGPSRRRPGPERFPTGLEQMQDLRTRAKEGRGYAAMLADAVLHAEQDEEKERKRRSALSPEELVKEFGGAPATMADGGGEYAAGEEQEREVRTGLEANEVVQEMHAKLLEVQDVLASNLDWAAAQASQSRARADAENSEGGDTTAAAPEAPQATPDLEAAKAAASARLASNNPFAAVLSGEVPVPGPGSESAKATTEEEDILSEVLSAMSEVSDALSSYATRLGEARERATEDAELAMAMARSVADTQVNRFAREQAGRYRSDTVRTHDYGEGVSGASAPSQGVPLNGVGGGGEVASPGEAREQPPLDSTTDFFASPTTTTTTEGTQPTGATSPYDGLEALAGLTFDSPAKAEAGSTVGANDPFAQGYGEVMPSPQQLQRQQQQQRQTQASPFASTNPYSSLTAAGGADSNSRPYSTEPDPFGEDATTERDTMPSPPMVRPVGSAVDEHGNRERSATDASFRSSYIPDVPSAKALGKIRRISMNQSVDEDRAREQQEQLEAAMREKYRVNREAELERREQRSGAM